MSLNYKEIDKILSEIDLTNTHLQKIKQTNFHTLYIEFYKPGKKTNILICLAPGQTRLHSVEKTPSTEIKLQRFAQFLRSRVKGGRVIRVSQINNDRIIKIELLRTGEPLFLWIRLWSGASNIICTDVDNKILDAFYRRPGKNEISGGLFKLPEERNPKKVFELRKLPGNESFNEKIAEYYSETNQAEELEILRTKVLKKLSADELKAENTLNKLIDKIEDYGQFEQYKKIGDILMSSLHLFKKGDTSLITKDFYSQNNEIQIELDPLLSPEKNAEKYYTAYKKAKSGIEKVKEDLKNQKLILKQIKKDKESFETETNISRLRDFISSIPRQNKIEAKEQIPGLKYRSGKYTILVGRSAKENDILLRKYVRGNDIWLHTRDYPGGYVFIKTIKGKTVPLENLLDAGNLALFYSKARNAGSGELYYTPVKYLRRAKDGPLGLVLPTHEKNLSIVLDKSRLSRMMEDIS